MIDGLVLTVDTLALMIVVSCLLVFVLAAVALCVIIAVLVISDNICNDHEEDMSIWDMD